ncbi:hypothetical protein H4R18_002117 [Coemansia javaensis]|uniref:P-type ATPase A domain-containing protein n=1 Tax=Coemansia javaensis TaxID=2761396 RepID=A0A9W8HHM9_9FUNG|nr:hypothetical protein H4R18_002117 [Coemansia javaensis]
MRWLVCAAALAAAAAANQVWHDVNRYDAHGNECKLRNKQVECSRLCVAALDDCPAALQPACPAGQAFCADGECHDECTPGLQARNPCHCSRSGRKLPAAAARLVPCPAIPGATVSEFHPWRPQPDIRSACAATANITDQDATVGVWGRRWLGGDVTAVWAECPPAPAPNYTYREGYWLATFAVNGALALLVAAWSAYKRWAERGVRRASSGSSSSIDETTADTTAGAKADAGEKDSVGSNAPDAAMDLRGYREHLLGTACVWSIALVTALWVCYLGVWTADYYGSLPGARRGVAYSLAYKSSFLELATFLVLWGILFALLIALYILKPRLRNYFCVQTLPSAGTLVCVTRSLHEVRMIAEKTGRLQLAVNAATRWITAALSRDREFTTCPIERTSEGRVYFTYQCTRYVLDPRTRQFAPFEFDLGSAHRTLAARAAGLSAAEAAYRLELVGPNFIQVRAPGLYRAFVRELVSFFYIYQFIFLWAFYFYAYYQVGLVDTGVVLLSATIKVLLRMQSERRLKRMAEHEEPVSVRRDGAWLPTTTRDLVPGDVIEVVAGAHMSCDYILLSGSAILDESSLTGEPLPVRKFPMRIDDGSYSPAGAGRASTLFAGTVVSQVQPAPNAADSVASDRVLALVRATGTMSDKGQLVRRILFPNPISFVFNEEIRIVVVILILCAIFITGMAAYMYRGSSVAIAFYTVFAVAQLLSPLLPAALVIGQSIAAARLRQRQIYCVDPQRIMAAGKAQVFCFDKTGTLTREGLEFYGVQPVQEQRHLAPGAPPVLAALTASVAAAGELLQIGVAACHAVAELDGQMIGNPVDIEQFRASQWALAKDTRHLDTLVPPPGSALGTLHVVRRFEFVHARASMSVVVQDERTGQLHVFVKGSFERIGAISSPGTVPADYGETCARMASEGCYVLAIAHRTLPPTDPAAVAALAQDEIEGGCAMLGLLAFKNLLKEDTPAAIAELKRGSTRTVMVTGDTALTGVYIARQCGMVPAGSRVILGECASAADDVQWTDVDTKEPVADLPSCLAALGPDGFPAAELAVGGAAFESLCKTGAIDALLLNIRIFARMKPAHKVECVERHMRFAVTAMCGDGGNDSGALRAAHVGIALSDAEASIVSPFSAADRSVMSCVELLRQGRAGLATSFANFAALICYGQIMGIMLKLVSFYFAISLTQNLWMLIDGAVATGLMLAISMSGPAKRLAPQRPTSRILGPQMLASVGGTVIINFVFSAMAYVWLFRQDWFRCNEHASAEVDVTKWWLLGDNYEASILSFVSTFQFINNGFVFNYGYKHRAAWYRNYALLVVWAFLVAFVSYMLLADPNRVGCAFRLNCGTASVLESQFGVRPTWAIEPYNSPLGHNVIPRDSRYRLWGYCLGNMAATNAWQVLVVNGPVRAWLRRRLPLRRLRVKH